MTDRPIAFGAMRLTDPGLDAPEAVLRAALDAGATLIDTANVYGPDASGMHANEALIARVVPSGEALIATKVGLTRKKDRWLPDGSPRAIARSAERSLKALGVGRLPLLQLHLRDPRVPFEETLGALARLHEEGKVAAFGLCNTSLGDVATALSILPAGSLTTLQNPLSPLTPKDATLAGPLLALAGRLGLTFLAHSPFGGRAKADKLLAHKGLRAAVGALDPHAAVLAWLRTLSPQLVPLPGATRPETARASATPIALPPSVVEALDAAFPALAALREASLLAPVTGLDSARALIEEVGPLPPPSGEEVILTVGIQGAGKSSAIAPYLEAGYLRLNRDARGGKLEDLLGPLSAHLRDNPPGRRGAILDNTYPSAQQRAEVIAVAAAAGVPARALFLDTPLAEAQRNVAARMLELTGSLLGPDEIKAAQRQHPNIIPPAAHKGFIGAFQPPTRLEGFATVERRPFERRPAAGPTRPGLLLDVDGTLRVTRSGELYPRAADDVVILPGRAERLAAWHAAGWALCFVSNQSGIASGKVSADAVQAAMEATAAGLGVPVTAIAFCPHPAFPVGCFCRKPMPGLGVMLMTEHHLDPTRLVMVGDMASDEAFAAGLGARYFDAEAFFAKDGPRP